MWQEMPVFSQLHIEMVHIYGLDHEMTDKKNTHVVLHKC